MLFYFKYHSENLDGSGVEEDPEGIWVSPTGHHSLGPGFADRFQDLKSDLGVRAQAYPESLGFTI
jgi:hypothetical protein